MWSFCGYDLEEGQKLQTMINIGMKDEYMIPATLINGRYPGKTVFVQAQVHSMEFLGTAALNKLSAQIDPEEVHGQIVFFHCVNITGFWKRAVRFMPEDGANLNAIMPADENGTISKQIAAFYIKNIYEHIDFMMDLHCGAPGQPLRPLLFFSKATRDEAYPLMQKLGVPILLQSRSQVGLYGYPAFNNGVPAMILERGCGGFVKKEWIKEEIDDVLRVLKYYGVYDNGVQYDESAKRTWGTMYDLCSDCEGIWYPNVELDQHVKKGEHIGTFEDFWGNEIKKIYAEDDLTVLYYTESMGIKNGHMLISYGLDRDEEK